MNQQNISISDRQRILDKLNETLPELIPSDKMGLIALSELQLGICDCKNAISELTKKCGEQATSSSEFEFYKEQIAGERATLNYLFDKIASFKTDE